MAGTEILCKNLAYSFYKQNSKQMLGVLLRLSTLLKFLDVLLKLKCLDCHLACVNAVVVVVIGCCKCSNEPGVSCSCKLYAANSCYYVAAKATYIRLLFGKMGVFGPSSVKRGRTHIVLR